MSSPSTQVSEQSLFMQRWIGLAPKPPNRGPNRYDAFISYRSSDRSWAMALYDALRLSGWEPFLDQFDLVPGSNLQTSLEENLQASSSGVILWSSRTRDSEWCKNERQSMKTRKLADRGFHYIFAKLDTEELPLFDRADLYVDFLDSPDGPRGANLLRLMCGMCGVPLDPEAVKLCQKIDEAASQILLHIKASVNAGNLDRLVEIGASRELGLLASPAPLVETARGLIIMGNPDAAFAVLERAESNFPSSVTVKQLRGLALRRAKRYQAAIDVLSELTAAGHQDPETLSLLAAAWDGRFQETGKTLYLRMSREMYRTAFQADPKNYYSGINAAAKSLFLGDTEESSRIANLVLPLVQHASDGKDFWAGCTLAEAYLLQKNLPAAQTQYQKIVDTYGERTGDLTSTYEQVRRICSTFALPPKESEGVLSPFTQLS